MYSSESKKIVPFGRVFCSLTEHIKRHQCIADYADPKKCPEEINHSKFTHEDDLFDSVKILTGSQCHLTADHDGKYLVLFKNPPRVEWFTLPKDHDLVKSYVSFLSHDWKFDVQLYSNKKTIISHKPEPQDDRCEIITNDKLTEWM